MSKPAKPRAWMRRWAYDGEVPAKVRNANNRLVWPHKFTFHEVTAAKLFADDVPLFGPPEETP